MRKEQHAVVYPQVLHIGHCAAEVAVQTGGIVRCANFGQSPPKAVPF
jgi:hypothetical protein